MGRADDQFGPNNRDERLEPLFETRGRSRGSATAYRVFAATVFMNICWIWLYRVSHVPEGTGLVRLVWIGMLGAEFWFGLYWFVTQAVRWNPVHRLTFKGRLSLRYENDLPKVDVFVCTADPEIEPPLMVVNTVLSAVALDYPPEKLAVYVSDDAGSELTFYALSEASEFAKHWVPFCKRFSVEPRSPAAYFSSSKANGGGAGDFDEVVKVEELYEEMASRIETAVKLRRVPEEVRLKNEEGFMQWDAEATRRNHGTILQILLDGRRRSEAVGGDCESNGLPTLVYLAREKRPEHPHNFKAGAINALIRVSSKISCGMIILNLDCDMYSNNSQSVRDALCFLLDDRNGEEIAFVQFPQHYENITRNDLYGSAMPVGMNVEFHGLDGNGGPPYIGTGCFHRREVICERRRRRYGEDLKTINSQKIGETSEAEIKALASCTYERNTQWGKEMGVKYGCLVEDVMTGLAIQCRGWKSAYFNPERKAFVGMAPTALLQTLVQLRRWSEGDFQILLSEYSPVWHARGKIGFGLRLGYCCYCFWAPSSVATLYYSIFPSLALFKGIPLFPKSTSAWFVPFAYVTIATNVYSLFEFLWFGGTIWAWWNEQRMWLYRRTSSYLFGFSDSILKLLGFSESAFVITAKVSDEDKAERYKKEIMEFGADSPMFFVLATLGLINLFCFFGAMKRLTDDFQTMVLQSLLTSVLVVINWPLYEGLFLRTDNGRMPFSVTVKSVVFALSVCTCLAFL